MLDIASIQRTFATHSGCLMTQTDEKLEAISDESDSGIQKWKQVAGLPVIYNRVDFPVYCTGALSQSCCQTG
jgi:hypothetical protein